ncbi:aryl hydrocarbon receptor protein 1-like isoform X2 [Artemia franciscana]|uniref:Aryl hydrocarbon receptor n=1 Tax=Artemia franciscana TaxID=6661 RepID=A0AA88L7Q6_ARTSF|nr:hypothetical protein QYM36_010334 [Artemia franciscana]
MSHLGTVYATKRRRRNGKSLKPSTKDTGGKSNPSKRHRERLNGELDMLASLLPYESSILSKLDRLSILRLAVSYLRTKAYFQVAIQKAKMEMGMHHASHELPYRTRDTLNALDPPLLDADGILQALNGFLLILCNDGEVFFATHSIESYLGFHQSDVVHQSVYELVHSEDREELQRQLSWNNQLPADSRLGLIDVLRPENSVLLERSFTVRFRCLLDNTSGFLRLDVRGRIKILQGQNRKTEEPPLALFAVCTPFGPPSLLELPHKDTMFKSKHRLDLAIISMDQRGRTMLGQSDTELSSMGGYDLVHPDDLAYVASAHQELLKTGASGLIAYRLQTKEFQWQWLQTSSRLVYKNSKPDFIISTHRPLMEEEGRDLLGKRTMDFKVSYLDAGLTSNFLLDQEAPVPTQKVGRRYKTQLRDFLSTCKNRRKPQEEYPNETSVSTWSVPATYSTNYPTAYPSDSGLYPYQQPIPNLQSFYSVGSFDNRFIPADNLFQYRSLSSGCSYYPDYYTHNSYFNPSYADSTMQLYNPPAQTAKYTPRLDNCKREIEESKDRYSNDRRQTVLMWGSSSGHSDSPHNFQDDDNTKKCMTEDMKDPCKWNSSGRVPSIVNGYFYPETGTESCYRDDGTNTSGALSGSSNSSIALSSYDRTDRSPLLSISEVTHALLNQGIEP